MNMPLARPEPAARAEPADGLAMVLIASSNSPLVLLDGNLLVVAASASFCRSFQIDPASIAGTALVSIGNGEWNVPQLGSLLDAANADTGRPIDAYEMDLKRPGRPTLRLLINVQKLVYADKENIRLLLAIADVTEARFNQRFTDNLVREKDILVQEMQHRIANSLQIIASVLMQSAGRVASDETRGHLYDAHRRVMSVASLQHHLATSRVDDVELRTYLIDLCKCISASMIQDPKRLSLKVRAEPSVVGADQSMSLGLIVTELVMNAIKHAFPDHRGGNIFVDYHAHGTAWALTVTDDGVGVPLARKSKAGLGTSLVQALARQLHATVVVTAANPGTVVLVSHGPDDETAEAAAARERAV